MLSKFSYGEEFIRLNQYVRDGTFLTLTRELLDIYAACKDETEIKTAQDKWLAQQHEAKSDTPLSDESTSSLDEEEAELDALGNTIPKD